MKRMMIAVAVVLAGGAFWYWYENGACGRSTVRAQIATMNADQRRYADGMTVLASTPLMLASQQIKALMDIKRETEAKPVAACLVPAKRDLIEQMGSGIELSTLRVQSLMGSQVDLPEETIAAHGRIISGLGDAFRSKTGSVLLCAPFCG